MSYLTRDQIQSYHKQGFLVIKDYASFKEIKVLSANARRIIDEFDMSEIKVFTTDDQTSVLDSFFWKVEVRRVVFLKKTPLTVTENLLKINWLRSIKLVMPCMICIRSAKRLLIKRSYLK